MRTIDITTTQNVTIEYNLAGPQDRFLAFFIDLIIVTLIFFIVFFILLKSFTDSLEELGMMDRFFQLLPITTFVLYHLISEILGNGQSIGKRAAGIKVVRLDGEEPGLSDYLLRAVFHVIDSLFTAGILAGLLISSSAKNQRLGDMTANTVVVRVKFNLRFQLADILNINSLDDYEPTYPEVRKLREKDLLLIKSVISRYNKFRNPAHDSVLNKLIDRLVEILDLDETPKEKINFLKTLIRDYIVLTR